MKMVIADTQAVRDGMTQRAFNWSANGGFEIDDWIFDHLNLEETVSEGNRLFAIHIIPHQVIEGEIVYCAFHVEGGAPTIYVSLTVAQDDFILQDASVAENKFSFARTVFGKIIRTLDQPHIGLSLPAEEFLFPAIIDGEVLYSFEVRGDNNHDVDEILKNLGNLVGRVTKDQILDDQVDVNDLSKKIAAYRVATDVPTDIQV